MTSKTHKYLLVCYLVIVVTGIVLYRNFGSHIWELLPTKDTPEMLLSGSIVPGVGTFTLLFSLTVFFSAPINPLFYLAAGYFYGAMPGAIIASLATTLGSGAAFLFFRNTITPPSYLRPEISNLFLMLVLLRCSPFFPSPLINLFCGVIRVHPLLFAASTLLGSVPLVSIYTLAASRMRGPLDISMIYSPEIITALIILGVVSLIGCLLPLRVAAKYLRTLPVTLARPVDKRVKQQARAK